MDRGYEVIWWWSSPVWCWEGLFWQANSRHILRSISELSNCIDAPLCESSHSTLDHSQELSCDFDGLLAWLGEHPLLNSFMGERPCNLEEPKDSSSTNDVAAVEMDCCENLKLSIVMVPVVWDPSWDVQLVIDITHLWLLQLLLPSRKKSSPLMPLLKLGVEWELKRLCDIASKLNWR